MSDRWYSISICPCISLKSQKTRPFLTFPSTPYDCQATLESVGDLLPYSPQSSQTLLQSPPGQNSRKLESAWNIRRSFEDHSKIIRRSFEDRSKIIQICPLLFCFGFETKISQNPLKILKSSARSWNLTNMTTKPPRSFVPNSDASNSSSSVELVAKLNHAAMLRWKKKTRPLEAAMTGSLSRSWSDRSSWKGAAVVLGVTLNV